MKMNKKGYLQISFAWLFALIAGAFILFLAIYAVVMLMGVDQTTVDIKTGKNFLVLTNSLESGFETGKLNTISFPVKTRIYNRPNNGSKNEVFGRQLIKISQLSFKKWTDTNQEVSSVNKYFFSKSPVEGKDFYLFSKPFDFPFKVADVIYIIPFETTYCFKNPTTDVEHDIDTLFTDKEGNQKILFTEPNCPENSINVCFDGGNGCNITVKINYVDKDGEWMYFYGNDALMYGAIFSDPEVYESQIKRLMMRTKQLAGLYQDKIGFISGKCSANLNLGSLILKTGDFTRSRDLSSITSIVEDLEKQNGGNTDCKIW